ncbi:MAG TPA: DnaJ family domain-containing protein [Bacillaceae bacterium]
MDKFAGLSEERIRKAYDKGEFDNLPGLGKPLPPDKLEGIPDELKMAYRVMKNAGFSPEEMDVKKELMTIEDLIRRSEDELEKDGLRKELNAKLLQYNSLLAKKRIKTNSSLFKRYEDKIEKKFF